MSALYVRVFRLQSGVTPVNHARIVTQPNGNLEQADAVTGEQAGERMPHRVGRYPFHALLFGVRVEVAGEIVTVAACAVFDLGMQHERFAHSVTGQEILKFGGKRNCALLAVFEVHCGCFPQMEQARFQVEPKGAGFDDLVFSQTGMEAAILNKLQILALGGSNEFVALFFRAEVAEPRPHVSGKLQTVNGVAAADAGDLNAPFKERPENHCIRVAGAGRMFSNLGIVERLDASGRDVRGGNGADMPRKSVEDETATVGAGGGKFVSTALVSQERLNLGFKRTGGIQGGRGSHFNGSRDGFREVAGFQTNEVALPVALKIQPVNGAAKVDAACCRIGRHAGCNVETVTLVKSGLPQYDGISRERGERVTRLELATSSLAKKPPVEGTVTLQTSQSLILTGCKA